MAAPTLASFDGLKTNFRGEILVPNSPGYDQARRIWNAMIDKRPGAIARCTSVSDVVAAVNFGRQTGLDLAVRGGGHNIAGNALCDGGLVIDLSGMNAVRVDAATRRARVGPGATLGDFDRETQKFNLTTPTGINSTTGIAGLTLGGGFGWLTRQFGMTVDNLVSTEVVTADGRIQRASANENADLFWALRGGGGNFGVVTEFEFQLHPFGPDVLAGLIVFPFSEAGKVMRAQRDLMMKPPPGLNVWAVVRKAPPLPFLATSVHGQEVVALAIFYSGAPADGAKIIEQIRRFGTPHGEHVGVQPFVGWQQAFDPLLTPGARNYWKSHNFSELKDEVIDAVITYAARLPSPHCEIFVGTLGGAAGKVAPEAMAYGNRDANFVINVHGRWETAAEDQAGIAWAREFFAAAEPFATGSVYVNFMTADETGRIRSAYGANYGRLAQIKAKYDPANVFHINQNIRPADGAS